MSDEDGATLSCLCLCGSVLHSTEEHEDEAWLASFEDAETCDHCGSDRHSTIEHEEADAVDWRLEEADNDVVTSSRRPTITLSPELGEMTDQAVLALQRDPGIFQQAYHLVHVTHVSEEQAAASFEVKPGVRELVAGTPQIHEMATATLRERLTRVIYFERYDARKRDFVQAYPPDYLVDAVAARKEWPGLRRIVGIAESPFMRPDGSIVQSRGLDDATGYLYAPTTEFPRVLAKPARADVENAKRVIDDIFSDFPFATPAQATVPIAAMMTILLRPIIHGSVPMVCADANTRGAGKSLMTDVVAYTLTGRAMPRKAYPRNEEELEKVLGAYAMRGAPYFSLDNINRELGGGCLDAVLTAPDTVELRVLGKSMIPTLLWRALIFATGNNLQFYGDTSDRALMTRIESPLENPRSRTDLKYPDLRGHVRQHRGEIVAALLTIARAWYNAGRPQTASTWGSFEAWSALIPQMLVFAGFPDVSGARITDELSVNDDLRYLATILEGLPRLLHWQNERRVRSKKPKKDGLTSQEVLEALYSDQCPGSLDAMRGAVEGLCNPRKMAGDATPTAAGLTKHLNAYRGRVLGGRRLRDYPDPHTKVKAWWSEITGVSVVEVKTTEQKGAGAAGVPGVVSSAAPKVSMYSTNDMLGAAAENGAATTATPATAEIDAPTAVRRTPGAPEGGAASGA